jgi:hypothetical protein
MGRKDVMGAIAHGPIIRIPAMLNATQIVAMAKISTVCFQGSSTEDALGFFSKSEGVRLGK